MEHLDIARSRLYHQHIAQQTYKKPEDIVQWMGAVQAQDYAGAKWALGMRMQNGKDAAVEKAMATGAIIRLHILRPTWHFVVPEDVRWMMALTAPRIQATAATQYRQLQLNSAIVKRSNDALAGALQGGKQLDRAAMMKVLQQAGIDTNGLRFIHLLMQAELDMVICSGAREGKQFTYALFDDRVPAGNNLSSEEALAELARRCFLSRGPATLRDFSWWSGLTLGDCKKGLDSVKAELTGCVVDGKEYWMAPNLPDIGTKKNKAYLLPAFDEFAVAYADRTAAVNPKYIEQARHVIFAPSIVVNNQVVGTWKRTINKNSVDVELMPFGKLNKAQTKDVDRAAERYKKFLGL